MNGRFDPTPYWRIVEDCLVELHGLRRDEAQQLLGEFHGRLAEAAERGIDTDLTYHEEEFNLACDLLRTQLPFEQFRERYFRIVARHYPGWDGYLAAARKPA